MKHACEPDLETLKKIRLEVMAEERTELVEKKIRAIDRQIKKRENDKDEVDAKG
jgi:hypothetical protein